MMNPRDRASVFASIRKTLARRKKSARPSFDALEVRQLLTLPGSIIPGQLYQDVAFLDTNGDTVEVKVNGPTSGTSGFTLRLAGEATNNADIHSLNLVGLSADNGLSITVTPNELTINAGPTFGKLYSSGYTNVGSITASNDVSALGSLFLSAAIVNDIALPNVAIGNITLDTGQVTFVDAVNMASQGSVTINVPITTVTAPITGEAEINDESPVGPTTNYNPTAGLIDLWNVRAKNIDSIVVNGSISVTTADPFDVTDTTNDLRGVIDVSGKIGSIIAPRSAMRNAIRADGIGLINLGQINGEITTRGSTEATTIYLPKTFTGFLNVAGHLNLGFTDKTGELATGNIRAGRGISGSAASETDPILVPDKYASAIVNTSTTTGIADVQVNGAAMARWYSASSIGKVTALSFDVGSLFEAGTNIGDVEMLMTTKAVEATATQPASRAPVELEGFFKAGGNIGNIKSATGIKAEITAGGNIGNITGVSGGLNSTVVLAGGNIGKISVFQKIASTTQIAAGGNIGDIRVYSGTVGWRVKARNIGDVLVDAGGLNLAVFVAAQDLGSVTVTSPTTVAIEGGSLIAGRNMGAVTAYAFGMTAIHGALIQAGGRIDGVSGVSYGSLTLPAVTAGVPSSVADDNNGIDKAQILGAEIGPILGQAYVGTGLYKVVVHAQAGGIDSITGIGNGDGIFESIVVAEAGIGPIIGHSTVLGSGIEGGSFDANGKASASLGNIGQITAQGGAAGGHAIERTRFQASNRIAGIDATTNANGGDALNTISAYASSFGMIKALVLGGQTGNGIKSSTIRAWSDYENNRPDVQVDGVHVDVRSALGLGITLSTFQLKGDLTDLQSRAFNASAISGSLFTLTQGSFGRIYAESTNGGTAIENSQFIADNGSITSARDLASAATSGITAIASGTSLLAHAISGSMFSADANIGVIKATTRGGTAILNSTFTADSNFGNANNGPNLPGADPADPTDLGAIFGVYAKTSGQHLASSIGISGSTFNAERIDFVTVEVTDREGGGAGISSSTFTARNAVYDGAGAFDNKGTIGPIHVTDGSLRGNGIEYSQFMAGAAGSIGDITVITLGGAGIKGSEFRASEIDYDQRNFTATIGNIRVTTGRAGGQVLTLPAPPNDAWTLLPAGIDSSYFASVAGIGNIDVNALGTGVFFSAFLADFDLLARIGSIPDLILPMLAEDVPGNLGNVNITSHGRFGFGSVFSVFTGASVGDINIRVASRETQQASLARPNLNAGPVGSIIRTLAEIINFANIISFVNGPSFGPAASAGSLYVATNGDIGRVNVQNTGAGFDSIASAYVALPLGYYGPVTPMDNAALNLFWAYPRTSTSGPSLALTAVAAPAQGTYTTGDVLTFGVDFGGAVTVAGQPTMMVNVGSTTRVARYVSGSGSSRLLFSVDVQAGDSGEVTIPAGRSIQFDYKNRIVESDTGYVVTQLQLPQVVSSGVRVDGVTVVDRVAPTVTNVSAIETSGARGRRGYTPGQVLTIRVTFSEAVIVQGQPTIGLTFGSLNRMFVYAGGSGTDTLTFSYTVTRSDVSARGAAKTNGLILLPAGAAITDSTGNHAVSSVATSAAVPLTSPTSQSAPAARKPAAVSRARAVPQMNVVRHAKARFPAGPVGHFATRSKVGAAR